jgi:hypothetical protein
MACLALAQGSGVNSIVGKEIEHPGHTVFSLSTPVLASANAFAAIACISYRLAVSNFSLSRLYNSSALAETVKTSIVCK